MKKLLNIAITTLNRKGYILGQAKNLLYFGYFKTIISTLHKTLLDPKKYKKKETRRNKSIHYWGLVIVN